ncbi:MAG TPA: extracellular solute-binding protein [Pseudonocardiaceae bacterium]|nr:extracellular solute-binding protein [Pseudonocardiaceae bacterium]
MRDIRKSRFLLIGALVAALGAAACSSGGGGATTATSPVTFSWWHNTTAQPGLGVWQTAANQFHASHPNVSFKISPIQNESLMTKIPIALQGNQPPDIFQQWGGGSEASEIPSGKLMDMTAASASWISELGPVAKGWAVNGKQYGVPFDQHIVGFWYRKDLFAQAGITTAPTTMAQLNTDIAMLKAHGIQAVGVGGKDRWPDAFYWDYFAVRECSITTLQQASKTIQLSDPCWIRAGNDLKSFLATQPFQNGFLGTPAQQGAGSSAGMLANGKVAMELQGDWEPGTMAPLTTDKNLTSKMGWFPFPSVAGGQGNQQAALGGGDGFSCLATAGPACPDFLKYIDSAPVQSKWATTGNGLPVNPAAASAITDPNLKQVLQYSHSTPYVQLYFDIAFPTNVGQALDNTVADFFAKKGTPQSMVNDIVNAQNGDK